MGFMELARADAQQRHRIDTTKNMELFTADQYAGGDLYLIGLRGMP